MEGVATISLAPIIDVDCFRRTVGASLSEAGYIGFEAAREGSKKATSYRGGNAPKLRYCDPSHSVTLCMEQVKPPTCPGKNLDVPANDLTEYHIRKTSDVVPA